MICLPKKNGLLLHQKEREKPMKERVMVTKNPVQVETVEAQAKAIAEVMENHWVFGRPETDFAFYEKHDFVGMVTRHAKENRFGDSLEVTYRNSDVRVIVTTQVAEGHASLKSITAFNHPHQNPSIDYDALNEDIQAVIS
jgi:hypothetical protein